MRHVYFRDDEDDLDPEFRARLAGKGVHSSIPYESVFRKVWLDRGKSSEEVDALWADYLDQQKKKPRP